MRRSTGFQFVKLNEEKERQQERREHERKEAENRFAKTFSSALRRALKAGAVVDSALEDELLGGDADSAPDRARLTAAQFFWHVGEIYDAKKHCQALLRLQPSSVPALTLSGWLELALAARASERGPSCFRVSPRLLMRCQNYLR